jgi:glycosyltransferase involved in cell wall biosynthesis
VRVEVVVVDDGSADETPARLAEFDDRRVRVLRNDVSLGQSATRNRGIAAGSGDWIALLDDDDLWSPLKLRTQLEAARGAGARWAYGAAVVVDERRKPIRMSTSPPPPNAVATQLLARNVVPAGTSNVLVETELLRRLGGFDERLSQLGDWDLWLRLAEQGLPAACYDVLVAYTQHASNILLQDASTIMDELDYIATKHSAKSRAAGVEFDRVAAGRWIAWGHRRAGNRSKAVATYLRGALAHRSPGNLVRAIAAALGERAMRGPRSPAGIALQEPDWLHRFG